MWSNRFWILFRIESSHDGFLCEICLYFSVISFLESNLKQLVFEFFSGSSPVTTRLFHHRPLFWLGTSQGGAARGRYFLWLLQINTCAHISKLWLGVTTFCPKCQLHKMYDAPLIHQYNMICKHTFWDVLASPRPILEGPYVRCAKRSHF